MSDPGITLDQYQQMQDTQRRQSLAAALMSGKSGQQNAAFGGLANVGSMLAGATIANKNQTDQQNMLNQMRYGAQPDKPMTVTDASGNPAMTPGIPGAGPMPIGSINAKTPLIQSKNPGFLSNLFSFGGGT